MSAAAEDHEEGGADERLVEETVDESQLKLPIFKWSEGQEVKSGEENEDVLYSQKCRLYARQGGDWKERGIGDIKLLQQKDTKLIRLIMRQEKTLKLRANHKVQPAATLAANSGNDRSWVFSVDDFAEEKLERVTFAVRFKDAELAKAFQVAYDDARAANKKLLDAGVHGNPSPAKPAAPAGAAAGAGISATASLFAAKPVAAAAAPAAAAPKPDASGPVPVGDKLDAIYGAALATEATIRYGNIAEAFRAAFGSDLDFYVRAPGRVNLIGEHIDYHGYSVLPMALAQDVVIAASAPAAGGAPVVRVANFNSAKYATATLPADPAAPVDQSGGVAWYQYVQCGYKGAFDWAREHAAALGFPVPEPRSLLLLVDGRVPPGAGVSSSSALTVASLLAVARAIGIDAYMTRAAVGEAARKCELYIGTMSGGMDQAISCLGQRGAAARIDFEPLAAVPVALPAGAAFVVSNCLEESAKAVDSEKRYNKRVTEGKLAAKLVAKGEGLGGWAAVQTFRGLQEALGLPGPGALLPAIEKHLRVGAYSIEDLQATTAFGADPATLFEGDGKRAGALRVLSSVGAAEQAFELLKRARHVASEAERVFAFQAACEGRVRAADGSSAPLEGGADAQLALMGRLMRESHASCRDDYECSSGGLEELTALAAASGAAGSRLTGAGWGGCAVSLVPAASAGAFIEALKAGYYVRKGLEGHLAAALFASAPGSGAAVYTPPTSFEC